MGQVLNKSTLTLIKSPKRREVTEEIFPLPVQAELFASYAPNILTFVTFPTATDEEFLHALDHSKPAVVIDVRRFPRFDIGSLTRQRAFEEFDSRNISYVDYAWSSSEYSNNEFTFPYLGSETRRLRGSVMILLEERPNTSEVSGAITEQIQSLTHSNWEVVKIPSFLQSSLSSASAAS